MFFKLLSVSFIAGALFSIGLALSGMLQPSKVQNFLDFTGNWDPSLAFVMIGAIATHTIIYRWIRKRPSPLLGGQFHLPTKKELDPRLLAGSALFGIGWGLGGFCPGPALVSLSAFNSSALVFVAAMLGGMGLFWGLQKLKVL
jgi:uncharacterized protein